MRQLTRLLVLAVTLNVPGCALIDAAGDSDDDSGDDADAGSDDDGIGPHRMNFTPSIVVTDACGLADELEVDLFVVEIDAAGVVSGEINPTGSSIVAVIGGVLDSSGGSGAIDCDPMDPDPPFVDWMVNGSPEEGFEGTYEHVFDEPGTLTIEAI